MTKLAHFLPVKTTHTAEDYAKLYLQEVVRLHGVLVSIISDRGAQFTTQFWKSFQKSRGSKVNLSTTFQPQKDGQEECTIQTLEDMLRDYVIDFKVCEARLIGPDLVHQAMEKVKVIQERISKRIGNEAYELELPQELAEVHPVFHISMLKKCMGDHSLIIPIEYIGIKYSLSYEEIHIQILDRQVCKLRTKEEALAKVL
ncbi:hypothetical protein MTR67_012157 [Solanum verrucosum]|uniref:Integrase catalytic domain-containing protein n=1 Tax=Solanum verrucosum TaxID=315347 RepID=A0AAF0TFQ5_SOLVR|nr:hypothetical protein MTR67_012157 [Solanum verrucosum]